MLDVIPHFCALVRAWGAAHPVAAFLLLLAWGWVPIIAWGTPLTEKQKAEVERLIKGKRR
ncbi:MAG: hypothetical protein ACYDBH_09150 [Acidobacteriaceae bacterium]